LKKKLLNKIFKLKIKAYDTASVPGCIFDTPAPPINFNNTDMPKTSTTSSQMTNLQATPYLNFQICKTASPLKLYAPFNYVIYIESLINGVPSTLTCDEYK
jgi:hypothetical protein